ncbi:MAG: oxygen-independent coproporphyrinogen III oxidase [Clostridia bacterium]|nr:oxygen-independent coproporphyrinogen III oxidase [Clostridia bacterium]
MKNIGIYVHIPFCKKKCDYCDFISFANQEDMQEKYVMALNNDIEKTSKTIQEYQVNTIYFGGGTPSYIDENLIVKILENIKNHYTICEDAEITIEINPGTVNKEKLIIYKQAGFNRLSIGLQSTHDRLLKLIGRIHTYNEFLETYNLAREVGFKNINVDLMLALPTQTIEELIESTNKIISLKPEHISIYSLILEDGTVLYNKIQNNELELIDEDLERKMYWKTKEILEKNGYNHYEISNFAKKGFESKHNMNCWLQEEYLGFGVAAHSYFNNKRFSRISNLQEYIKNIEEENFEKIIEINEIQDREARAKEYMLLGLRKIEGVSISAFERKFEINPLFYFRFEISKLEENDLLEVDLDNIKLTKKGLDLANQVFEEFV